MQQRKRHYGVAFLLDSAQQTFFQVVWNLHLARGNLRRARACEAQLAVTQRLPLSHAHRWPEYPAGHGPPGVEIAAARHRVKRRTGRLVGILLKALPILVRIPQQACPHIAGELCPMFGNPCPRPPLDSRS